MRFTQLRARLCVMLVAILLTATACGSVTPTRPPASPTLPPVVQPTAPVVQPTVASLPTVGPSPTPVAPTGAATAPVTQTVARATSPAVTAKSPTSKPAALSGQIAYGVVTDPAPRLHTIWVANVNGSDVHKILDYAAWPAFSPDGKRIAFFWLPGGGRDEGLYIADSFGGNPVAAIINPGVCCINWSRDGKWIVYTISARPNEPGGPIFRVLVDGVFQTNIALGVQGNGPAFSPDGNQIVYSGCLPNTSTCGVLAFSVTGGSPRVITRDNGGNAQWSPRGDKIVYQATDDAGRRQVFVVNVDGSGKKQLTSGKSNDGQPIWSRDGGSIFWRSDQNGTGWAIFVMNADGSNRRKVLSNVPPDPVLWGWESLSLAP